MDADLFVTSHKELGIEVVGPVRPDSSWQAQAGQGSDVAHFRVDWQAQQVICPQGCTNTCWTPHPDARGNPVISVKFSRTDCRVCPVRSLCTKAAEAPRHLTLRPQAEHETLQRLREQQTTPEWKRRYERALALRARFHKAHAPSEASS